MWWQGDHVHIAMFGSVAYVLCNFNCRLSSHSHCLITATLYTKWMKSRNQLETIQKSTLWKKYSLDTLALFRTSSKGLWEAFYEFLHIRGHFRLNGTDFRFGVIFEIFTFSSAHFNPFIGRIWTWGILHRHLMNFC